MEHVSIMSIIFSVSFFITSLLFAFIKLQLNSIERKYEDLCERIKEERDERKEINREKREDLQEIYTKLHSVIEDQVAMDQRLEALIKICEKNHINS